MGDLPVICNGVIQISIIPNIFLFSSSSFAFNFAASCASYSAFILALVSLAFLFSSPPGIFFSSSLLILSSSFLTFSIFLI